MGGASNDASFKRREVVSVKKILYVCSRPPFPTIGGREHMIVQSLKFLVSEFDVHVACFAGRNEIFHETPILELGVSKVTKISMPSSLIVLKNLVVRGECSIQENLYYSASNEKLIVSLVRESKADLVVSDMLRAAQFCFGLKVPVVVDLDDILSKRYQKMLELGTRFSSLGTFSDRIPKAFYWGEKLLRKVVISFEQGRIADAEARAITNSSAIILTSPLEAEFVNNQFNTMKATGVSQCVTLREKVESSKANNLLFIGNMTTAQNLASLEYIAKEVLPLISNELDDSFNLLVVGRYDQRAESIAIQSGRIKLLGFIDDLNSVAQLCSVALMPVAFGTGVKTKVLDAMGMGMPVVTNIVGAEGISIENGVHAVIDDTPSVLAKQTVILMNDRNKADEVAERGREYVTIHHSFENLRNRYNQVIKKLLVKGKGD